MEEGVFSDENDLFPVNMTVKGLGLIPKEESLKHYIDVFGGVIAEARTMPWAESLHKRVEAMIRLYGTIENLDPTMLGGIEIFEGRTFENLRENPYASLLYMGMKHTQGGMEYISFQVNGKVEILEKENLYYKFLLASRKLFEFDKFHLYQPNYPFGYLIKVLEVRDKSPWSRIQKDSS
ncbi:MAG: pyridoxamine 5'-phosphate oxidase family protein [Nitrospirota bacterium]